MKKILIIEDDKAIAELERDYLEASDYEVKIERDGLTGEQEALTKPYDLIILDIMLPGADGFSICRAIREKKNIPVLLVSAKREDIDKIRGLGLGANDYITKPFHPQELVARVKAHLANYDRLTKESSAEHILEVDNLRINQDSHEVYIDDELVFLPNKEYELLVFLATHPNMVFSKEQLFEKIWGLNAIGEISTVTVHINRIRDKIERNKKNNKFIETVWGSGYRFRKK